MTKPIDLAALARLCDEATKAGAVWPREIWTVVLDADGSFAHWLIEADGESNSMCFGEDYDEPLATYIAGMNEREEQFVSATKALLAEVAALRGEVERMRVSDLQIARYADGQRALAEQAELRLEHACRQRNDAIAERDAARSEVERMRPVVEAVRQWRVMFDDSFFGDHGKMYQVDIDLKDALAALDASGTVGK